jgi:hypothetical protein
MLVGCALAVNAWAEVWLKGGVAPTGERQLVVNPSLEEPGEKLAGNWSGWQRGGYEVDEKIAHAGRASARCAFAALDIEAGVLQNVTLNQTDPVAILARVWSRAEKVSGAPDSNYSLYIDIEYTDGTPLWGQTYAFNTGTHDWQQGAVLVVPAKPIKSLTIYGIFRGHQGTAWFDDFELYQVRGAGIFDLQPAVGEIPVGRAKWERIKLSGGPDPMPDPLLDAATGAMSLDGGRVGGLVLRDAAAASAFVLPKLKTERIEGGWRLSGEAAELKLAVDARLTPVGDALRLEGTVRDLSGKDRAITVFWALPLPAGSWRWCQDARTEYEVTPGRSGLYFTNIGCGSNGQASKYPFGAVAGKRMTVALGGPISEPRLMRFSVDGPRRVLYAACDLGLSAAVRKSPSAASFTFLLFGADPRWKFRGVLKRYYDLNAEAFKSRAPKHGIWMPFVDVGTVDGWEDFGFQFQEGAPNPAFDNAHGIYSFPYIEPLSYWMAMPAGAPHTDEAALKQLDDEAARGVPRAVATKNSAFFGPDGRMRMSIQDAPWCKGALFLNSASPGVPAPPEAPMTQYKVQEEAVKQIISGRAGVSEDWAPHGAGFTHAEGAGRKGSGAAFCERQAGGQPRGAVQSVTVRQKEARPIVVTAWSKAEGVTGDADNDYSLYVDLMYDDDTPLYGQITPFAAGSHDWQQVTVRIEPAKPVRSMGVNLLLRGEHTGKAWFDDVSVREEGSDRELARDGGFEGQPKNVRFDGLYLDSFEMACMDLNYRREHFAGAELPLVYDRAGNLCQLGYFITMEMTMAFAKQIHDSGRMMMANGVLWSFPWAAGYLDVFGTETNWAYPEGTYTPVNDEQMLYWRAMCGKRPYLTLLNTVFEKFPHEWVEKYFARCCYYGVLPSMFSHNAADAVYWNRPEIYNRDRDLFRKYIPVIRAAAEAGWEPVTMATTDSPEVWVERYGSARTVYFTVFNAGKSAVDAKPRVDLRGLGIGQAAKGEVLLPTARDLGAVGGDVWSPSIALQPEQVAVLKLTW